MDFSIRSCFYSLLGGFFWDSPQLHLYGPLDGLYALRTDLLDNTLDVLEKKSHMEQD